MRPFVHRLAVETGLAGFVRNGADGVTIEVEGSRIADFVSRGFRRKRHRSPGSTRWRSNLSRRPAMPVFVIGASTGGRAATRVVPDAATCPDCLAELFDPASRFLRLPVRQLHPVRPALYDHPPPALRPASGPPWRVSRCARPVPPTMPTRETAVSMPSRSPVPPAARASATPLRAIAAALRDGRIVALKGIGGFHLLCDARNEAAVAALRRRKSREAKPFAVMVANAASLAIVARATAAETALAASMARPIVLMQAVPGALAPSVSPGLARVGVMLAYAPLHHLLFAELAGTAGAGHDPHAPNPAVLVATSANPGGEPLVVDDAEAERRLAGIADLIVTHDRPIVVRADDSVAQIIAGAPALMRRARGFVPDPIELPADGPDVLALGGHLKTTVTVTRGPRGLRLAAHRRPRHRRDGALPSGNHGASSGGAGCDAGAGGLRPAPRLSLDADRGGVRPAVCGACSITRRMWRRWPASTA